MIEIRVTTIDGNNYTIFNDRITVVEKEDWDKLLERIEDLENRLKGMEVFVYGPPTYP